VSLDSRKNACTIKFKEIVSAEKAAEYATTNFIWNDMNVKVIYNTMTIAKTLTLNNNLTSQNASLQQSG